MPQLPIHRSEGYWPIPLAGPIVLHCPPLMGWEEARSAGWWGSFEGWHKATPPCEERGAKHGATSTSDQTMTGEGRAGHGRQRSYLGREDQADATSGGRWGSRSGARAERSEAPKARASADRRECGLPVGDPNQRPFQRIQAHSGHRAVYVRDLDCVRPTFCGWVDSFGVQSSGRTSEIVCSMSRRRCGRCGVKR